MLLTKEVEVNWNTKNKKHLIEKGYNYTKIGDSLIIKVEDLTNGSHTPIKILCDYCLEEDKETIIEKPYFKYINARKINPKDCCDNCKGKKNREIILSKEDRFHYDYNTVYNDFLKNNKLLQTDSYLKVTDLLPYICIKHKNIGIQYMSYADLLSNHKECKLCKIDKMRESGLLPKKDILKIIEDNNFILVSNLDDYMGIKYYLNVICKNHIDKGVQPITLHQISKGTYSCKYCYKESISGENSLKWRGGVTTLQLFLRNTIKSWKKESAFNCNYKCTITGKKFNNIHHLHGFDNIFNDFINQYDIKIFTNINNYTQEELKQYEDIFIKFHNKFGLGICLNKNIHKLFHKLYGNKKNTKEQFDNFKVRLKSGEFDTYLKDNNLNLVI